MTHFNTTNEAGAELGKLEKRANKQEDWIMKLFHKFPYEQFSPSYVHETYVACNHDVPITSIRRAMTVLTQKGLLRKTEKKQQGPYGNNEHLWELA